MELDFHQISKIVGISPNKLQKHYNIWSGKRKDKGRDRDVVDLRLLAALSGLSVSSVSNFLNNTQGSISEEKSNVLEKLTDILGYIPSKAAVKLRSSNKMSIGFVFSVTSGTSSEYYVDILRGVKREADKYGYFIDIYDIEENKRKDFFSELPFMGLVDGLIIVNSVVTSELLVPLVKRKIPVVLINPLTREIHPPVISGIYSDSSAFSQLLEHLFKDHKYRNPVLISVELNNSSQRVDKYNMFVKAAGDNGIDFDEDKNTVFISAHSFSEGMRAYEMASEKNPYADVYVCLTDTLAISIIRALEKDNKKAAVTGYANFEIAQVFDLTTIEQNIRMLGSKAFQHLFFSIQYIQRHNEFPEYSEEHIPGKFIKRGSCGCME